MGGSERVIWHLATGLRAGGHDVRIIVPGTTPGAPPVSGEAGVEIRRYADPWHTFAALYAPSVWLARRALDANTREWRPDVLHLHHAIPGLAAAWGGHRPRCYTFYGPWHLEFLYEAQFRHDMPWAKRWTRALWMPAKAALARTMERAAVTQSDRVVVLSQYSARQVMDVHRVADGRLAVIPGGVDLDRFHPVSDRRDVRAALGLPKSSVVLFTVRRLVPRMGLEMLLEALRDLAGVTLVIGGSGWLRPTLEAAAHDLDVADRVRFAGFIPDPDLPRYYQAADLVVVPSIALEGFGLITLEALACGTPVVATRDSGSADVLRLLDPSWLAEPTPSTLAQAIEGALAARAAPAMADRCRTHAAGYGWSRIVDRYVELYRSLPR
jgi:glycosyltransferase involved in cell wall biosynthesis